MATVPEATAITKTVQLLSETILPSKPPAKTSQTPFAPETSAPVLVKTEPPTPLLKSTEEFQLPQWFLNSWIAFASWGHSHGIFIIKADASEWKILTENQEMYDYPTWSPDGHWLAYFSDEETDYSKLELFIVNIDGRRKKRLTYTSNGFYDGPPAWSPDGNYILFTRSDDNLNAELYLVDIQGNSVRQVTRDGGWNWSPVWAKDGKSVYFLSEIPDSKLPSLVQIDLSGEKRQIIIPSLPAAGVSFSISPSGEYFVFRSNSKNLCGDLVIYNKWGLQIQQFTFDTPGRETAPSWSPDEDFIVYNATKECDLNVGEGVASGWEIYIQDIQEGTIFQVTHNPEWYPLYPAWSPVPALVMGQTYTITELGDQLNLRASPSLDGDILQKLRSGDAVTILEGPLDADDYYWWRIQTAEGIEGWAVEVAGWYEIEKP